MVFLNSHKVGAIFQLHFRYYAIIMWLGILYIAQLGCTNLYLQSCFSGKQRSMGLQYRGIIINLHNINIWCIGPSQGWHVFPGRQHNQNSVMSRPTLSSVVFSRTNHSFCHANVARLGRELWSWNVNKQVIIVRHENSAAAWRNVIRHASLGTRYQVPWYK